MAESEKKIQNPLKDTSEAGIAYMLDMAKSFSSGSYEGHTIEQLEAEKRRREQLLNDALNKASDMQDRATTLPGGNLFKIGQEIDRLNGRLRALQGHSPQIPGQDRFIGGHPIDGSTGMKEVNRQGYRHRK